MNARAILAESAKLRGRPATWIVSLIWFVEIILFAYTVPYIVYRTAPAGSTGGDPEELLQAIMPGRLVPTGAGLFPLYGAVMMVILGAVLAGGEYRWGTLVTVFSQGPRRSAVLLGKVAALALALLVIVIASFAVAAAYSTVVAFTEGRTPTWPGALSLLEGVGVGWLICLATATAGLMLAVVTRSTTIAIGIGLVWLLALENAIAGLAMLLPALKGVRTVLLGANAGTLTSWLGATTRTQGAMPSVAATGGPLRAALLLAGYVVVFTGIAVWVQSRRDVT